MGTATVEIGDAETAEAIGNARTRLPEFLALARKPAPNMHTFAVKVPIPTEQGSEYIWITPFEFIGDHLVGRVSNVPQDTKKLNEGDRLKFSVSDIADWSYRLNGKRKGNFTGRAIASKMPPLEAQRFLRELNFDPEP
jgi:uncharacterized protein YegJ (DUF2314 family)